MLVRGAHAEVVVHRRRPLRHRRPVRDRRARPGARARGCSRWAARGSTPTPTGIRFRNIALDHELPWTAVRAVAFERKSPWASLVLRNGDEVALFAVQAVDKERARPRRRGAARLLAAAQAQEPAPPPLLYDN